MRGATKFRRVASAAALMAFLAAMSGVAVATAQETESLQLVEAQASAVTTTAATPAGRASITIRNISQAPLRVQAGAEFKHDLSAAVVAAAWTRSPGNQPPDADGFFTIAAGETATFDVRGTFPVLGAYETSIGSAPGFSPHLSFPVVVNRTAVPVPADFLADPKPVRIDLGLFEALQPDNMAARQFVRLAGFNATAAPIELGLATAGALLRSGSTETAVATQEEPAFGQNSCTGVVLPGQGCALTLQIPRGVGAGAYSIDVAVQGPGGGQSLKPVTFEVRASAWLAGLLIAAGVALGAAVTDWRNTGRAVADRRIAAADLRMRAERLATSATKPAVQRQAAELGRDLRALDATLIEGGEQASRLADLEGRLEKLALAEQALVAAEKVGQTSDLFGTLVAQLQAALVAGDWSDQRIEAPLASLRAELEQYPRLVEAARRLDAEIGLLRSAVTVLGTDNAAIAEEWRIAFAEREKAFRRLNGGTTGGTESAARTAALDKAAGALADKTESVIAALFDKTEAGVQAELAAPGGVPDERKKALQQLSARLAAERGSGGAVADRLAKAEALWRSFAATSGGGPEATVESVEPGGPKSFLPAETELKFFFGPDAFQPAIGASAAELREARKRWDMITNLAVLAGIAATGVLVLWVPDPSWGGVEDVVAAILAGAATRLAIGNIALPGR